MPSIEPTCDETVDLLAYAQAGDRDPEALLLCDDTLYVQVSVVDEWLSRSSAQTSDPLMVRLAERIRRAKER